MSYGGQTVLGGCARGRKEWAATVEGENELELPMGGCIGKV